jgi:hypothetical protein
MDSPAVAACSDANAVWAFAGIATSSAIKNNAAVDIVKAPLPCAVCIDLAPLGIKISRIVVRD